MRLDIALCCVLLLPAASGHAGVFEQQLGYVCHVERMPDLAGPSGTGSMSFGLTGEPQCRGEQFGYNFVCPPDARATLIEADYCSSQVRFNAAEQALLHAQLLLAMEKNLTVSVGRENCVRDRNDRGCFFGATVYSWRNASRSSPAPLVPRRPSTVPSNPR